MTKEQSRDVVGVDKILKDRYRGEGVSGNDPTAMPCILPLERSVFQSADEMPKGFDFGMGARPSSRYDPRPLLRAPDPRGNAPMSSPTANRVLLVEDERDLRSYMAILLTRNEFDVVEADDGLLAVERFHQEGPFNLAIIDMNLPGCTGLEVCRELLASDARLPIIICTAGTLNGHEKDFQQLGVNRVVAKPFYPEELLEEVSRAVGQI